MSVDVLRNNPYFLTILGFHDGAAKAHRIRKEQLPREQERFGSLPILMQRVLNRSDIAGLPLTDFHRLQREMDRRNEELSYYQDTLAKMIIQMPGAYKLLETSYIVPGWGKAYTKEGLAGGRFRIGFGTGLPEFSQGVAFFDRLRAGKAQRDNANTIQVTADRKPPIIFLPVGTIVPVFRERYGRTEQERLEYTGDLRLRYASREPEMIRPGDTKAKFRSIFFNY